MRKFTLAQLTPPVPTIPATPVNRVIFANDRSGSMHALHSRVTQEVTKRIAEMAAYDAKEKMETYVTIYEFSSKLDPPTITDVLAKNFRNYQPYIEGGGTALNHTVVEIIKSELPKPPRSTDESVLFLILTDGRNESNLSNESAAKAAIASLPTNWTVTLIGPGAAQLWGLRIGILADNMLLWDGSSETFGHIQTLTQAGLGNYYATRSAGGQSVSNFYTVDPNKIQDHEIAKLHKLAPNDFKLLTNLTNKIELKPFLEQNAIAFKKGVSYYELIKPENIQADKDILVMDDTGAVYGKGNSGAEIRQALGLPIGTKVLVHPRKGKYKIFVQSNSNNRKLIAWTPKGETQVRGQQVIVLL